MRKKQSVLALPPKFACYEKINTTKNKAELERTFTNLRWKEQIQKTQVTQNENSGVFQEESHTFNFVKLRATDVPFNQRVCIPPPSEESTESKLAFARQQVSKLLTTFEHAGDKSIVTRSVQNGIRSLQSSTKDGEIVCFQTDKSGKMSVDSKTNYVNCMKPHHQDMELTNDTEYTSIENLLKISCYCL